MKKTKITFGTGKEVEVEGLETVSFSASYDNKIGELLPFEVEYNEEGYKALKKMIGKLEKETISIEADNFICDYTGKMTEVKRMNDKIKFIFYAWSCEITRKDKLRR